jgi:transposase
MTPDAVQVADPFHLIKLANTKLDECRRRVQNETPVIAATRPIPSIGVDGSSPRRNNGSTRRVERS